MTKFKRDFIGIIADWSISTRKCQIFKNVSFNYSL